MRKKFLLALTVCSVAVFAAACGAKNSDTAATTAASSEAQAGQETTEAQSDGESEGETESGSSAATATKPDLSKVDPIEALGPGAVESSEDGENAASVENQNFSDLENSDYKGFAKQVLAAVAAKDMNALADLMNYPVYIACVKENDGIVDNKEAFLALDPEEIFDQSLLDEMAKVDVESLEPLQAGVVLGEDTPNIIINSSDGKLGINGINY